MKKMFSLKKMTALFMAAVLTIPGSAVLAEETEAAPAVIEEVQTEAAIAEVQTEPVVEETQAAPVMEAPTEALVEETAAPAEEVYEEPAAEAVTEMASEEVYEETEAQTSSGETVTEETAAETETETVTEEETMAGTETETVTEEETIAETEAASETESETAAESELESETETESETEEENYLTEFFFENDEVEIKAYVSVEAKLPENAVMKAKKLEEGTAAFEEAKAASMRDLGTAEDAQYIFYDVEFSVDGNAVEIPKNAASISLRFKNVESGEQVKRQSALHIENTSEGKFAEDVTAAAGEGSISSIDFTI